MSRLKDADALISEICRDQCEKEAKGCGSWCELIAYVENAPTVDAVPVVRCKDCKHYKSVLCPLSVAEGNYYLPAANPNWFCADGERRSGNEP